MTTRPFSVAAVPPSITGYGEVVFNESLNDYDRCKLLEDALNDNQSIQVLYTYQFKSVSVEWNYFCSRESIVKLIVSIQMFGIVLGSIVFGQISDLFGRKRTVTVCVSMTIFLGLSCVLSQNLLMFGIIRFFCGFFVGGNIVVMYVYVIEQVPTNARIKVCIIFTWSPNFIILSVVAHLTGDWRSLAIVMNLLAVPSLICFTFLHESARWLLQKGCLDEAQETVLAIARWGGNCATNWTLEFDELEVMSTLRVEYQENRTSKRRRYYAYHLFCWPNLLRYSITLPYSCFTGALTFYALMFNMDKVAGSLSVNTAALGLLCFLLNLTFAVFDHNYRFIGRRITHSFALSIIVSALSTVILLRATGLELRYHTLVRVLTVTASSSISLLSIVNEITCAELYPTAVRNLAGANIAMCSRIGCMIGPQLFYLASFHQLLPYIVIVVLASIDAIAFCSMLPETKNCTLIDQMPSNEELIFGDCKCIERRNSIPT